MSTTRGRRVTATGLVFMLFAVSAGVASSESGVLLGFAFAGVLVGANLVAVGVTTREEPTASIGLTAPAAGAEAFTASLRRNLAVAGLIMASVAVTAVAGDAGQVLCLAMFALLLLAVSFVTIRFLGE